MRLLVEAVLLLEMHSSRDLKCFDLGEIEGTALWPWPLVEMPHMMELIWPVTVVLLVGHTRTASQRHAVVSLEVRLCDCSSSLGQRRLRRRSLLPTEPPD